MKVDFKSRKLNTSIIKVIDKVKDNPSLYKEHIVYGVTKEEGISLTGNVTSEDLSEYIVVGETTFAFNPYRVNIGSIGLSKKNFKGLVSPAYVVFKTKSDLLPEFLFSFLKSDIGIKLINWYGNRGGVRNALRFDDLGEIDIPDLTVDEQRDALKKIKATKDKLAFVSKELEFQQTYLQQLRQAILQDAVQGKLTKQSQDDETGDKLLQCIKANKQQLKAAGKLKKEKELPPIGTHEIPFELPKGWVWCRLGDIGSFFGGSTPSKQNGDYWSGNIPWVTPKDMKSSKIFDSIDHISQSAMEKTSIRFIDKGALLIVVRGMVLLKSIPIATNDARITINQDMKAIVLHNDDIVNYIQLVLLGFQPNLLLLVERSTHGTGKLESKVLTHLVIPLAPLSEQHRLVAKVEQLMQMVNELENQVEQSQAQAEQLLQAVLKEAFSNKGKEYQMNEMVTMAAEK